MQTLSVVGTPVVFKRGRHDLLGVWKWGRCVVGPYFDAVPHDTGQHDQVFHRHDQSQDQVGGVDGAQMERSQCPQGQKQDVDDGHGKNGQASQQIDVSIKFKVPPLLGFFVPLKDVQTNGADGEVHDPVQCDSGTEVKVPRECGGGGGRRVGGGRGGR